MEDDATDTTVGDSDRGRTSVSNRDEGGDSDTPSDRTPPSDRLPRDRTPSSDRIPIDLSGGRSKTDDFADAESDESRSDVTGPEPNSTPVEPGSPDLENALFVLLGALGMLVIMARLTTVVLA